MSERVPDWTSFWNQPHSIYVSARHFDVHYRDVADGIVALMPRADARVLDHGCGEATHADRVAAVARELLLCELAASVRERLAQRFAANRKIKVLSPEEVERLPAGSLDMVMANSLVQYLSPPELGRLLGVWRILLAPGGILVVADVIPPHVGPLSDTIALLRYAAKNGFLFAALIGICRTLFSPYRAARAKFGLSHYGEIEFLAKLKASGFEAERLSFNIEQNQQRMTFRARLR